jgi:hypothetical protein
LLACWRHYDRTRYNLPRLRPTEKADAFCLRGLLQALAAGIPKAVRDAEAVGARVVTRERRKTGHLDSHDTAMKWKTLFDDEWVSTSPMMSRRFGVGVLPKCEICGRLSCAPSWYSIKRKVFRCRKCFTPKILQ